MSHNEYPQAGPPEPITCGVYLFVLVIFVVIIGWILLRVGGLI